MKTYPADQTDSNPYAPPGIAFLTPEAAVQAALYYSSFDWIASTIGVSPSKLRDRFAKHLAAQPDRKTAMRDALRSWSASFTDDEAEALLTAMARETNNE